MRPPSRDGLPTVVHFHVTVMGQFEHKIQLQRSSSERNGKRMRKSIYFKYFYLNKKGLDSIDENSMTYAADIFFAQTWKDHRLRLPENMTKEYRLIEVDWLKNMWRPDS